MPKTNSSDKDDLDNQLNILKNQHKQIVDGIEQYMVQPDADMPNFGNIQVYDYDADIDKFRVDSLGLIQGMAELYLEDTPSMLEYQYIKDRIKEDAKYYADMQLLQKMSEKLLLQQLRQIDQGDTTPKMYEIANQTMDQIRANIKDGRNARSEIERNYRNLRTDFGLKEVVGSSIVVEEEKKTDDETILIDAFKLNDAIEKANRAKNNK